LFAYLFYVQIARCEETRAQVRCQHDSLQTQYNNCHSQVRVKYVRTVDRRTWSAYCL